MERIHPLRSWRESQDPVMTRAELARRAGLAATAIGHIEESRAGCGRKAALGLERATRGGVSLRRLLEWQTDVEFAARAHGPS